MESRSLRYLAVLAVLLFLSGINAVAAQAAEGGPKQVSVQLKDAKGNSIGSATIRQQGPGVQITLNINGLSPGEHAVHFHQIAKCDPPDFKSAGPHFNPENKEHGLQNPKGHHAGDMLNFIVAPDGTAKATLKDDAVVLGDGMQPNSLFANGGTALVIHAKPDDMMSNPAGNAGDRIACGIISK